MGHRKPNLDPAYGSIRESLLEISSPYNDGFTAKECKFELYQLKCWLEDQYACMPTFTGEELWDQERIVDLLKK